MSAVSTIKPHLQGLQCPEAMRNLAGWLTWRLEYHDGEPKPRKVPFYSDGGKRHGVQGRPEDRDRLTTFDAAKAAAARRGMDGVGFCPMPEWGIVALDFDNCVTPAGIHPDVERLVTGTYAEFSPSGNGVRAFVRGFLGNRKDHGGPFGFEVFSSKGFVTLTGNALPICELTDSQNTIADTSDQVLAFCSHRFQREAQSEQALAPTTTEPLGLTPTQLQDALDVLDPSMGHDGWLRVGMALHHETQAQGFDLWDAWSADGGQYPGSDALQARWDSFGHNDQNPVTAHALVRMANAAGAHIDIAALEAADDFEDLGPPEPKTEKPNRFAVVESSDFAAQPLPKWIVRDVLPEGELVVLFGESTAGKSFVAQDIGEAIARGLPWRGKKVRQGRVAYVVAEGKGGFSKRLKAYEIEHGVTHVGVPFGIIPAAPNLMEHGDAVEVAKAIVAWGGADVIIVDTFAQTMPGGNENAGEDVGKALANCKGLHRATGAVVVLVHHAGKDVSKGARGWSGLKAAADAEIEVSRGAGGRAIRTSKQKDGEDGIGWGFDLKIVPVGMDEDGEVETSCVIVEAELPAVHQVGSKKLGPVGRVLADVINEIAQSQTSGIEIEPVVAEAARRLPEPTDRKRDTRKQRVRVALRALTEGEDALYLVEGDSLSIV